MKQAGSSGKNSVQIPAAVGFVFVEGPQGAAVGVADDEVIAAAIAAVPPAALDAFGAGEDFVVFDGAAFGFWQQPAGAVCECGAVCLLIQCAGAPAVFRAVILYAGNAGDRIAAEAGLQAFGQLLDALLLFRCVSMNRLCWPALNFRSCGASRRISRTAWGRRRRSRRSRTPSPGGQGPGWGTAGPVPAGYLMVLVAEHNL